MYRLAVLYESFVSAHTKTGMTFPDRMIVVGLGGNTPKKPVLGQGARVIE